MRGITEERLRELTNNLYGLSVQDLRRKLIANCEEINPWLPIDENTPKDRGIRLYAPAYLDLPAIQSDCKWHPDAGFCIDELRTPTHWQELPEDPK